MDKPMDDTAIERPKKRGKIQQGWRFLSLLVMFFFERCIDLVGEYARIVSREKELFLGASLGLLGLFSFESDKFCDGNTANYLSCTRPSTYYYFDALDITLIIIGVSLVLVWVLKNRARAY